jgi:site-specific DNA recombinase
MPSEPAKNFRVGLYARVSTEEQREGQTIDSQVEELRRFAQERGWLITGVYKDEGWSGSILARPELDRLRDDASKGSLNTVLINDVDRLARDVTHLGVIKRDLERRGVQVIFRKLPSEKSPTQDLMVNILGSFAEFEREMITDRTRRGKRHKVEVRKQYLGSIASYGFRYVRRDRAHGKEGMLQVDPEEAAVVRQMYCWVDQEGLSARKVLNRLNGRRISTKEGQDNMGKIQCAPNPQERDLHRSLALLQIPSVRADKPKKGAQIQEILEEQQTTPATQ